MQNLIKIGYLRKAHGIQGEFKVVVEDKFVDDFLETEVVFLDIKGDKVPYFVQEAREGAMLLLKLEGIDTRTQSEQMGTREMYMRREDIQLTEEEINANEDETQYGHLVNYQLWDKEIGLIGKISEVLVFPQQEMAKIRYNEKERLIPLQTSWIQRIDRLTKKVIMELPEGLLDL